MKVKARDIKKKLLEDYDRAISNYRKTINCQIKDRDVDQSRIRTLETQLRELFGIEEEFDFQNIY